MPSYRILAGDCVARMGMMEESSIDNCITDPPYEIGFMGKGWDNTGVAYNPRTWRAVHRVLKPNGFLAVFAATRTQHRIAHAIERAGFEIIDIISWCYGTGFPKSHNISKAIDKKGGKSISWFGKWFKNWRLEQGLTQKEVGSHFLSKSGKLTGCVFNWEEGRSIPTNKDFNKLCKLYNLPFSNMEEARGEYLGKIKHSRSGGDDFAKQVGSKSQSRDEEVFATATEPAKQWEGWGTALKPAYEPIIIARKKGSKATTNYSQFYYISKASKKEKNAGLSESNTHPTVKPIAIMKALIEDFTEEGTVVFDPFTGSGSTGIATVMNNRTFIGCELTPEYIPIAKARIEHWGEQSE
jgi:DNA modification methylase/transcriptional regulator with XRE-family HTH domain